MTSSSTTASRTPVIASQVGGLPFTVQDGVTGFLVPGRGPPALAEKITLLVKDQALRHKLGTQGIQWAQQHSWAKVADQIMSLYSDLVPQATSGNQNLISCRDSDALETRHASRFTHHFLILRAFGNCSDGWPPDSKSSG